MGGALAGATWLAISGGLPTPGLGIPPHPALRTASAGAHSWYLVSHQKPQKSRCKAQCRLSLADA